VTSGSTTRTPQELLPGLFRNTEISGTTITYRWFYGVGSLFKKIVEILLLVVGCIVVAATSNGIIRLFSAKIDFSQALISILFFICGFFLAYRGLLLVVNHSIFLISNQGLSVRHGPLPGAANFVLQNHEIAGVEWRKVGHTNRSRQAGGGLATGYSATFDVILTTNSGKTITLVSGISAREYAFAIASEISKYLNK
jgi:hypothetical protein